MNTILLRVRLTKKFDDGIYIRMTYFKYIHIATYRYKLRLITYYYFISYPILILGLIV